MSTSIAHDTTAPTARSFCATMFRWARRLVAAAVIIQLPVAAPASSNTFDTSAIERLMDVLDEVMALHADSDAVMAHLDTLSDQESRALLRLKREQSAGDAELNRRIDALLGTTAYQLYYLQFRNMTPDHHREILYALPFEAIRGPAGISNNLKELCFHRDVVRRWVQGIVDMVEPDTCRRMAEEWLPEGQYVQPKTYFIYDGNGDAFTQWGSVVFDLFSLVLAQRPPGGRFDNLGEAANGDIEPVLSHEYHHVFARQFLYPAGRSYSSWQERQKDMLVREVVSEGVAMRCDGRRDMQRSVMEDRAIVTSWIDDLQATFAALDDGSMDEAAFETWRRDSYQAEATRRLRDYLARIHGENDLDARVAQNNGSRPSLVYTLGWWMIGRIAAAPGGKESVIGLLANPGRVFDLYNATLLPEEAAMRIELSLPHFGD